MRRRLTTPLRINHSDVCCEAGQLTVGARFEHVTRRAQVFSTNKKDDKLSFHYIPLPNCQIHENLLDTLCDCLSIKKELDKICQP